jgi:hypothetical protein
MSTITKNPAYDICAPASKCGELNLDCALSCSTLPWGVFAGGIVQFQFYSPVCPDTGQRQISWYLPSAIQFRYCCPYYVDGADPNPNIWSTQWVEFASAADGDGNTNRFRAYSTITPSSPTTISVGIFIQKLVGFTAATAVWTDWLLITNTVTEYGTVLRVSDNRSYTTTSQFNTILFPGIGDVDAYTMTLGLIAWRDGCGGSTIGNGNYLTSQDPICGLWTNADSKYHMCYKAIIYSKLEQNYVEFTLTDTNPAVNPYYLEYDATAVPNVKGQVTYNIYFPNGSFTTGSLTGNSGTITLNFLQAGCRVRIQTNAATFLPAGSVYVKLYTLTSVLPQSGITVTDIYYVTNPTANGYEATSEDLYVYFYPTAFNLGYLDQPCGQGTYPVYQPYCNCDRMIVTYYSPTTQLVDATTVNNENPDFVKFYGNIGKGQIPGEVDVGAIQEIQIGVPVATGLEYCAIKNVSGGNIYYCTRLNSETDWTCTTATTIRAKTPYIGRVDRPTFYIDFYNNIFPNSDILPDCTGYTEVMMDTPIETPMEPMETPPVEMPAPETHAEMVRKMRMESIKGATKGCNCGKK